MAKKIEDGTKTEVFGKVKIVFETSIDVAGFTIPMIFWYPYSEVSVEDYLKSKTELLKAKRITEEEFSFQVQKMLSQGRYIPKELPQQMVAGKMRLQQKIWSVPLPQYASALYTAIKHLNPFDRSRQGNTNNLIFPDGLEASIGSFTQLVMGISGTRESPNGGNSGGFSPAQAFQRLVPFGYDCRIVSTSNQYNPVFKALEERKAKQAAEALKAKPAPKAKSSKAKK